ncbi:MAG: hypothetical protein J7K51_00295 [Thermotogae bacterium]|nr:hypothetical protein [Thermotogota bacterium]
MERSSIISFALDELDKTKVIVQYKYGNEKANNVTLLLWRASWLGKPGKVKTSAGQFHLTLYIPITVGT